MKIFGLGHMLSSFFNVLFEKKSDGMLGSDNAAAKM